MPAFGDNKTGGPRYLEEVSFNDGVFEASFDEAFDQNPGTKIAGFIRNKLDDSPIIGRDVVASQAKEYGVNLDVPEEGMRSDTAGFLIQRKYEQKKRQQRLNQATPSIANTTAKLSGMLVGSLVDPINVAESFIPVYGEARWAAKLSRVSSTIGRVGVRASKGFVAGVQGNLLTEGAVEFTGINDSLQEDIDAAEFSQMILLGGVLGGGLHVGVGAMANAFSKTGDIFKAKPNGSFPKHLAAQTPEARYDLVSTAIAQAVEGRRIDVLPVMRAHQFDNIRAYNDLSTKLKAATAKGDAVLAEELSEQMTKLRSTVADIRFQAQPLPERVVSRKTLAVESRTDGVFDVEMASKNFVSQVDDAINANGQKVTIQAKGIKPTQIVEVTPDGNIKTADGGEFLPQKLVDSEGFRADFRDDIPTDPALRQEYYRSKTSTESDFPLASERDATINDMRRLGQDQPGSDLIDEAILARNADDIAALKDVEGLDDIKASIDEDLAELKTMSEIMDETFDAEFKAADEMIVKSEETARAIKAFADCKLRG